MLFEITCVVLSVHFARIVAGNVYRAAVAFRTPAEDLARMIGKTELSRFERPKLFLHVLLSS